MPSKKTFRLTVLAIFIALLLAQTFIPNLGYIRIVPPLPAVTTIPLTVAVFAALFGPGLGALLGLTWGILSLIVAYTQPFDPVSLLLFQNPLIAILPRTAAGWLAGYFSNPERRWHPLAAGLTASLVNSAGVILLTSLLFMGKTAWFAHYLGHVPASSPLIVILLLALGGNAVLEAIFTGVLTPLIVMPLRRLLVKAGR